MIMANDSFKNTYESYIEDLDTDRLSKLLSVILDDKIDLDKCDNNDSSGAYIFRARNGN